MTGKCNFKCKLRDLKETQTRKAYYTESYKYCIIIAGSKTNISKTHRLLNKMLLSLSLPFSLFTVACASFAFLSGRIFTVLGHSAPQN